MFSSKLSEEEEGIFGRGGRPSPLDEDEGEGEGEGEAWEVQKSPSPVHRAWPMMGLAVLVLVAWFSFGGSVRALVLHGVAAPDRTSLPCTQVRVG